MKNVIVLIGAPATGKSTLAAKFASELSCKEFSFDEIFPLEKLNMLASKSKEARAQMIQMIEECECSWIVVDDTNHYHSMQKRYLSLSKAKIVFVYLRAELCQLEVLKERNSKRKSGVSDKDVENILRQLNGKPPIDRNLLEFNYQNLPSDICSLMIAAFENVEITAPIDTRIVTVNAKHELNNRLNERIHQAFKLNHKLDGKLVSKAKRDFLNTINDASIEEIDGLVLRFAFQHLFEIA